MDVVALCELVRSTGDAEAFAVTVEVQSLLPCTTFHEFVSVESAAVPSGAVALSPV